MNNRKERIAKSLLLDKTCNSCRYNITINKIVSGDRYTFCDNKHFSTGRPEMAFPEENTCEHWVVSL